MKICEKCIKEFPSYTVIDGKRKNLSSRRFCLECSPFGKHNTRDLTQPLSIKTSRGNYYKTGCVCYLCNSSKKIKGKMCSSCRTKIRRHRAKLAAIAHMGGKCERCGWDAHPIGFEFHHKEDETKEFTIGKISNKSWAVIVKELKKCELLCSCCHRQ